MAMSLMALPTHLLMLTGIQHEHDGGVDGEDVGYESIPPGDVRRGRWCSGCRGGVQSAVTSAMAVRVEDSSAMALLAPNAATRACSARLLTARG